MFKASNGAYVNFRSSGLGSTWYTTDINGVRRTVEEDWETKERRVMYHDPKDQTEPLRIVAVQEYKDHQQQEFLAYLEIHPEMKQYA